MKIIDIIILTIHNYIIINIDIIFYKNLINTRLELYFDLSRDTHLILTIFL